MSSPFLHLPLYVCDLSRNFVCQDALGSFPQLPILPFRGNCGKDIGRLLALK